MCKLENRGNDAVGTVYSYVRQGKGAVSSALGKPPRVYIHRLRSCSISKCEMDRWLQEGLLFFRPSVDKVG